jgi:serine O-acetyltransferase
MLAYLFDLRGRGLALMSGDARRSAKQAVRVKPFVYGSVGAQIATRADLHAFLDLDLQANGMTRWTFSSRFRRPTVHYQRLLRRVEYLQGRRGPVSRVARFWFRYRLESQGVRTGLSIPPGVFGAGLSIAHYGTVTVNSRARVGMYCRIHTSVTIGIANGGTPRIGNFVYIAPGAVLYGAITVGDYAVIGANAVVNTHVPARGLVVGAPGRVVSLTGSAKYMPAFFPDPQQSGADAPGPVTDQGPKNTHG